MILVISNIDTFALPKISLSFSSAFIMRLLMASCSSFFLIYSQIFFTTSVRGSGMAPTTAASIALGVIAFMKPALGVRFTAGLAAFLGAAFLMTDFLTGAAAFLEAGSFRSGLLGSSFLCSGHARDLLFCGCTLTASGNTPIMMNASSHSAIRSGPRATILGLVSLNHFLAFLINAILNRTKQSIRLTISIFELNFITQERNHVG